MGAGWCPVIRTKARTFRICPSRRWPPDPHPRVVAERSIEMGSASLVGAIARLLSTAQWCIIGVTGSRARPG